MTRKFLGLGFVAAIALAVVGWMTLSGPSLAGTVFTGKTPGIAINGADAVAYFTEKAAVTGKAEFSHSWNGVDWHFASAANRDAFAAEPERYAPQYGGYCAFAAANGSLAKTEPEAFSIHDGKLYLNYDLPIRERWDAKREPFIEQADANWPGLQEKAAER